MSRIVEILKRARDSLADPNAERWSDDRLLRILDEGQKDLARQATLLKGVANIVILPGIAEYELPQDCWRITRAHYNNEKLQLLSHDTLDMRDSDWYTETGTKVRALVFDRRNESTIRVHPTLSESSSSVSYTFEQLSQTDYAGPRLGIVVDITDYTFSSDLGEVVSLFDTEVQYEQSDDFGVVTDIYEANDIVTIFYIKDPLTLRTVNDNLIVHTRWDTALKNFVIGNAFLDDLDVQYQQRGATALQLYERDLNKAKSAIATDNISAAGVFETQYNGGI